MRVQRHAEEQPTLRHRQVVPGVGGGVVDLERGVERAVGVVEPADGQHPAVGQRQQRRVPAAVGHLAELVPLAADRIEPQGVGAPEVAVPVAGIRQVPAGRQQAPIRQEAVAAAEEVERLAVGSLHRSGMDEVGHGGRRRLRIPDDAGAVPLARRRSRESARTWLLPEPAKNITFPLGRVAAWTASTCEEYGSISQQPWIAGSASSGEAL